MHTQHGGDEQGSDRSGDTVNGHPSELRRLSSQPHLRWAVWPWMSHSLKLFPLKVSQSLASFSEPPACSWYGTYRISFNPPPTLEEVNSLGLGGNLGPLKQNNFPKATAITHHFSGGPKLQPREFAICLPFTLGLWVYILKGRFKARLRIRWYSSLRLLFIWLGVITTWSVIKGRSEVFPDEMACYLLICFQLSQPKNKKDSERE